MVFDSKGDFYVDEEAGNPHPAGMPAVGCYANSAIPAQFQAWANNGTFTFEVINNNKLNNYQYVPAFIWCMISCQFLLNWQTVSNQIVL